MKMKKQLHILLACFAILAAAAAFAQPTDPKNQPSTDEQLAVQYYQAGEYDKALVYYEKLFNKKPIALYYNYYLACMIAVKDFKKAERVVKKQARNFPYDLRYQVDLGRVYRAAGEEDKAMRTFNEAINTLQPNQEQVVELAQSFLGINEPDLAIETYKKGRKLMSGFYGFNFELAEVYAIKKDHQAMVNELMEVLEVNEGYLQQVQNALQTRFGAEADEKQNLILKNELLRRVQKQPDKTIFAELLMWMFMQQKDYEAAFVQAKALDKRRQEDGSRVMSLAETCVSSGDYEIALRCYDYVIALGQRSFYYGQAQIERANVLYRQKTERRTTSVSEAEELKREFEKVLAELGPGNSTAGLIRMLAHVEAFYLHKNADAIKRLEEAIQLPQLRPADRALLKLELGDVLLLDGQVWEASLRYSQVEKEFKHDLIGQDAKFRNSKVYFYVGDFLFAQAQLDVLKGSTEKLIANDAMDLSLLITDNLALDSNEVPLLMYARADLLAFQNKDAQAMLTLDSIVKEFPAHTIADNILYKRYQVKYKQGNYTEAADFLLKLVEQYSFETLGDDAHYRLAELYDYHLNQKDKAMQYYQEILTKYPGSMFVVDARKRYRTLRGDKL